MPDFVKFDMTIGQVEAAGVEKITVPVGGEFRLSIRLVNGTNNNRIPDWSATQDQVLELTSENNNKTHKVKALKAGQSVITVPGLARFVITVVEGKAASFVLPEPVISQK